MDSSTLTVPVGTRSDRLLGRKVLVTGSSKGIGRGIAIRLAEEGADVVINYNSDPRGAEEALAEVEALGRRGAIIRANLGTVAEVRDLVARSAEALGGLDVLVNNAGIEKHAVFWDVTESDFDAVLNVNLKGVFFATGLRPAMQSRRPSRQDCQHQLRARRARVPSFCRVLREQRRSSHADAHACGGARSSRDHDKQHRARCDRNADQHQAPERSGQAAVPGSANPAEPTRQAE